MTRWITSLTEFFSSKTVDRLALFGMLWGVSKIDESMVFFYRLVGGTGMLWWFNVFFALGLIWFRGSLGWLLLLTINHIFMLIALAPGWVNHQIWGLILDSTIAVILSLQLFQIWRSGKSLDRAKLTNVLAPAVIAQLLVVYLLAALHKTNWDFLNPQVSCAGKMLNDLHQNLGPFIPVNDLAKGISVWSTLFAEWSIPLFIFNRRTRPLGVVLALAIHTVWAVHPSWGIFDFSVLAFALLSFLFPDTWFSSKLNSFSLKTDRVQKIAVIFVAAAIIWGYLRVDGSSSVIDGKFLIQESPYRHLLQIFEVFVVIPFALYAIYACLRSMPEIRRIQLDIHWRKPIYYIPITLMLVLGLGPYFGYRTAPAFSMFSNIRTYKPLWNHVFLPPRMKIFDYEEDVATVVSSTEPLIGVLSSKRKKGSSETSKTGDDPIPFAGIVSAASAYDGDVQIIRGATARTLISRDGVLQLDDTPIDTNFWQRKFMSFRPIFMGTTSECRW